MGAFEPRLDAGSPLQADWSTAVALLVVFVVAAAANAAGTGGGPVFVPMFYAMVGFPLKLSTALSQAVVTGGALASWAFNVFQPRPGQPERCILDYGLALVFTPPLALGVNVGVRLGLALPDWAISALLALTVAYTSATALTKGVKLRRQESADRLAALQRIQALAAAVALEEGQGPASGGKGSSSGKVNQGTMVAPPAGFGDAAGGAMPPFAGGSSALGNTPPSLSTTTSSSAAYGEPHGAGAATLAGNPGGPAVPMPLDRLLGHGGAHNHGKGVEVIAIELDGDGGGCHHQPGSSMALEQGSKAGAAAGTAAGLRAARWGWPRCCGGWRLPALRQQWRPLGALLLVWLAVVAMQLARSRSAKCSPAYWALFASQAALCLVTPLVATYHSVRRQRKGQVDSAALAERQDIREMERRLPQQQLECAGLAGEGFSAVEEPASSSGSDCLDVQRLGRKRGDGEAAVGSADVQASAGDRGNVICSGSADQGRLAARVADEQPSIAYCGTWAKLLRYQAYTILVGVLCGIIGVSGALAQGPLLLTLGVQPQVNAATVAVMAALSSGIAVIQNAALGGALNPSYAALFGSEAALAALVGVTVISSYVRRTGRVSAIVLLLGGVIAAGGCVMLAFGIADIVSGLRGKGAMSLLKFGSICGSDD